MTQSRLVIQSRVSRNVVQRSRGTRFEVGGAEYQGSHARIYDCPGTHRARLERYVERALIQPPRAEVSGCRTKRQYLGMCSWVSTVLALIACTRDHFAVVQHNGTYGHVAVSNCALRFGERMAHCGFIVHIMTVRPEPLGHSVR